MGFTAPGALMARIAREAVVAGGRVIEFPTSETLAPSQHCLCGAKSKKPLSQRYHACEACGLGVGVHIDRDLFSALIARLVALTGCINLSEGPFLEMDGAKGNAERLCSVSVAAPSPERRHDRSANPVVGPVAAVPAEQTSGQHATCANRRRPRTPRKAQGVSASTQAAP
jgi:hypothetical protein